MVRTNKVIWLAISVCAVIVCWAGTKSLGDSAGFVVDPITKENLYSGKPDASVGAWYDELWRAKGYFLLQEASGPCGGPGPCTKEYRYERIPTLGPNPNLDPDPVAFTNNKPSIFPSKTGSSAIPQDLVVTDWRVTGHVHFAAGM
ncbi:MAG: hypothetical protein NTY14_06895 [Candidatus Omnitrophica bacterium]|nr:hypothetical protein [Candidatus Omnitrophota bacterium]